MILLRDADDPSAYLVAGTVEQVQSLGLAMTHAARHGSCTFRVMDDDDPEAVQVVRIEAMGSTLPEADSPSL